MNSQKSLWGDLSQPTIVRTPFTILKEQASILSEATSGLLVGDVWRFQDHGQQNAVSNLILRIVAPSLDNYHYSILEVTHDIKLYPLTLNSLTTNSYEEQCDSEEAFEKALGEILSSPEVRKIISALLSDIYANTVEPDSDVDF